MLQRPIESTQLLSKFPAPGMNLPETPFHGYFGQVAGFSAIGISHYVVTGPLR